MTQENGETKLPYDQAADSPNNGLSELDVLDMTATVVEYVQLALDSEDPAEMLFGEITALVSAAAIVLGRPPTRILNFIAEKAPDTWPENALEDLIQAGLVVINTEVDDGPGIERD